MSNKTITQLPIVTSATDNDKLVIVQNDVTSQISVGDLETSAMVPSLLEVGRIQKINAQTFFASDEANIITIETISNEYIDVTGGNTIKILKPGSYIFEATFNFVRDTSGGNTCVSVKGSYGGGNPNNSENQIAHLNDSTLTATLFYSEIVNVTQAEIDGGFENSYIYYMLRDSTLSSGNGSTDGKLGQTTLGNPFFSPIRPLVLEIFKLIP